ncbi:MAG: GntR family transcriptional regulator [Neomegalonema sp.]|nr:GntR family transcriptional regulator [Neomegalonema sp.]
MEAVAAENRRVGDLALAEGNLDRSRPLGPQIYEIVRLNIILENLKPNDRINETDLSRWFEVSRTPVRDAYQRLIDDGLIVARNKVGTLVSPVDEARVSEGIVIRRALELEVVKLICARKPDLRELDAVLALQHVAVAQQDHIAFFKEDEKLHAALAQLAGLPAAWRLAQSVKAHTDRARIMLTKNMPGRMEVALGEHLEIVDALRASDAKRAAMLISQHINSAFDAVKNDAAS